MSGQTSLGGAIHRARFQRIDQLIAEIARTFPVLASCTASNSNSEYSRVVESFARGNPTSPNFEPPPLDRSLLSSARQAVQLARAHLHGFPSPWDQLYDARLVELTHDLEIVASAFTKSICGASANRFARASAEVTDLSPPIWPKIEGLTLATVDQTTVDEDNRTTSVTNVSSDGKEPDSLVSQLRRGLALRGLAVQVVVRSRIGALAATGDGIVIVAAGRVMTEKERDRVVVHEIEGHVLPRERGRRRPGSGLFGLGFAGANEDEEGRALCLEEEGGMLVDQRKNMLLTRHAACGWLNQGATFVELVRALVEQRGLDVGEAVSLAMRIQRGGYFEAGALRSGLARERIYLPSYVRVRQATLIEPSVLARLGSARLALDTLRVVDEAAISSIPPI